MKIIMNSRTLVACMLMLSTNTYAGLEQMLGSFANELENRSAYASFQTYKDLIANAGCFDTMRAPAVISANGNLAVGPRCTGQTYQLFKNVRAIVHTGNELTNDGPTQFSLGLDKRGLGLALRWDAAEEYSAQGSLSSDYLRGQLSSLSSRLTALRLGGQGFYMHAQANYNGQSDYVLRDGPVTGGGAGDEVYSAWGGFINYSGGRGTKAPTSLEDAFAFDGSQLNAGIDYRINDKWIVGSLLGLIDQRVDFDSSKSTVSGNVDASGFSIFPFAMYQLEHLYLSASVGYQKLKFDSVRAIRYPSLNPDIPSPNTETIAAVDAQNMSLFLGVGYNMNYKKVSLEPFLHVNTTTTKIDQFIERDIKQTAFDLVVAGQKINAANATVGATLRYTFTPSIAVITPYLTYEFVKQKEDSGRTIAARYFNAVSQNNTFGVPTDLVDEEYTINTFGISAVLLGAHQTTVDGVLAGGLQAFLQYKELQDLENYKIDMIELGIRYEF